MGNPAKAGLGDTKISLAEPVTERSKEKTSTGNGAWHLSTFLEVYEHPSQHMAEIAGTLAVAAAVGLSIVSRGKLAGLSADLSAVRSVAEDLEFPTLLALKETAEKAVEIPRVYPHPERILTQREMTITDEVKSLYETSFPIEERQRGYGMEPTHDAVVALRQRLNGRPILGLDQIH